MKKIGIIVIALLLLISILATGCLKVEEDLPDIFILEDENNKEIEEEGYILSKIAPNVFFVQVTEEPFNCDPSIHIKKALKEITTTHTIENCVAIEKNSGHGSQTASLIVFVKPEKINVS